MSTATASATSTPTRRTIHCGRCGQSGHNALNIRCPMQPWNIGLPETTPEMYHQRKSYWTNTGQTLFSPSTPHGDETVHGATAPSIPASRSQRVYESSTPYTIPENTTNTQILNSIFDIIGALQLDTNIYEDDSQIGHSHTHNHEDPIIVTRQNDKTEAIRRVLDVVEENIADMSSSAYKNIMDALGKEYNT